MRDSITTLESVVVYRMNHIPTYLTDCTDEDIACCQEFDGKGSDLVVCSDRVPTDVGTSPLPVSCIGSGVNVSGRVKSHAKANQRTGRF